MIRLIIRTMPSLPVLRDRDGNREAVNTEPVFKVFEFDCDAMEKHLAEAVPAMHRRLILGYEIFDKPKAEEKKEDKKINPDLAKRLEQLKSGKNGKGEEKSKFAKWEEKAKLAKKKQEAAEAKGYQNGKGWWQWRKPATS